MRDRRFFWQTGWIRRPPMQGFWSPTLKVKDPQIPHLPLETESGAPPPVTGTAAFADTTSNITAQGKVLTRGIVSLTDKADNIASQGKVISRGSAALSDGADGFASQGKTVAMGSTNLVDGADNLASIGKSLVRGIIILIDETSNLASVGKILIHGLVDFLDACDLLAAEAKAIACGEMDLENDGDSIQAIGESLTEGFAVFTTIGEGIDAEGIVVPGIFEPPISPPIEVLSGWSAGGKLGEMPHRDIAMVSFTEGLEYISAQGKVFKPEIKGKTTIDEFIEEEEVLALFSMID